MSAHHGSCLCGAVRYVAQGDLRPSIGCHCVKCRKTSGHYWSATQVATEDLTILGEESLTWFRSSPDIRRGFCRVCGSSLFWQVDGTGRTSIGSGTLDTPTGITTTHHICTDEKGDYYVIPESEA
ncbi:MAG TPA: aldehyde-activating protein [Maritimibacter sp.]|nr:aldehyde-activating protein [Maritimibacter sp.]